VRQEALRVSWWLTTARPSKQQAQKKAGGCASTQRKK
jgi:hypothetical protein